LNIFKIGSVALAFGLAFHVPAFLAPGASQALAETPKGGVYCGGTVKDEIGYQILSNPADEWNAVVTVNGRETRAMTAYSYFGKSRPPQGFVVALLGEDQSDYLVFDDGGQHWLEVGDRRYEKCR